jgi:aspartyl-tRNA(Asn)/glutamyl-tRNA(Gln) amidotransferase subunit A
MAFIYPARQSGARKVTSGIADGRLRLSDIFTISCNLAGIPGLSLPCGFTKSPKLPIGLQLLGKPFGEETLLQVAHAYEQATGWHRERPLIG